MARDDINKVGGHAIEATAHSETAGGTCDGGGRIDVGTGRTFVLVAGVGAGKESRSGREGG